jgi:NADH-quinone oxidoreductase subunit H
MLLILLIICKSIILLIPILLVIAYFTLIERKLMGSVQRRRGPNVVGYLGLLQPLADGLKLFVKETVFPANSDLYLFLFSAFLSFFLSLCNWAVIPFNSYGAYIINLNLGILYLLVISSLNVYSILLSGWSSNSKYAYLGSLRSVSQMISYELSLSFVVLSIVSFSGSFNINKLILAQQNIYFFFFCLPGFFLFLIISLAETNRHPFDLPEAEAELVSGYNVEYSAMLFALFFLGEYGNMFLMSMLINIFFMGGWFNFFFGLKILFFIFFFCLTRAALPRYRYDKLMFLGWKTLLPLSMIWFLFCVTIISCFNLVFYIN